MALRFEADLYERKVRETEDTIAEKRGQLASSTDPFVVATLRRSVNALEDMLVIFRKTAETLTALQHLKKAQS